MSKICNECSKTVDDDVKFCPYCKNQSFRPANEIAKSDNNIVHKLFYWNYDGKYMISKEKITAICVFLMFSVLALASGSPGLLPVFAVIIAGLVYLIGYSIHQIVGKPSQAKINHNDYGLITDLKHLLFFWQNNDGEYVLAKTKIASHIAFLIFFAISFQTKNLVLFSQVLFALIFEIPVFLIGYLIHRFTNPNPQVKTKEIKKDKKPEITAKPQINNNRIIPEYLDYQLKLDELNSKFKSKEKSTKKLIEKRFEPPQLTYTRFIGGVDNSAQVFNNNLESAHTMINLADEYSPRIAGEVERKINILEEIINKLDDLSNELVVNNDLSDESDVDDLISEMDNLINSVKDYNEND